MKKIVLGAGCFWGVEELFSNIKGVLKTRVGYTGGDTEEPKYEDVCSGLTNHCEVVEILFDEKVLSLKTLLEIFFKNHDASTLNRQGPDIGTQYRSAIFYTDKEQEVIAFEMKEKFLDTLYKEKGIVTQISKLDDFYEAEEYHQKYIQKNKRGSL